MTISAFWNESWTMALVNHLWQSTAAVGVAWVLTLALRKNHASARYWVWFAASVKFLLPFSLLTIAGEWMRSLLPAAAVAQPAVANALDQAAQPFSAGEFFGATAAQDGAHHSSWALLALLAIWACGALIVLGRFARAWRSVHRAKHAARPIDLAADVPVLLSPMRIEPGIFGILRPVLLLPEGILQKLAPEQLSAIVAHEMCHVRQRDNLTFAVHMVVETLFWFHPAVWWIGARLIEERECACDEAVVAAGGAAPVYAEGILNVCRFYVESPVACVAGVTGADLKMRIVRIMSEVPARRLSLFAKLLFAAIGTLAAAAPLTAGLFGAAGLSAQLLRANAPLPSFEVATIKPISPGAFQFPPPPPPNVFRNYGVTARDLVRVAYGLPPGAEERVLGGPNWIDSNHYDVEAKIPDSLFTEMQKMPPKDRFNQTLLMVQSMLADRLKLRVHFETREMPIYELVVAKGGPKLTPASEQDTLPPSPKGGYPPPPPPPPPPEPGSPLRPVFQRQGIMVFPKTPGTMEMIAKGVTLDTVEETPSFGLGGSPLVNKTGLTGKYDFVLDWAPDHPAPPVSETPASESNAPPLSTALEEQLGLKLVKTIGPVEIVVIDHIERPSEN